MGEVIGKEIQSKVREQERTGKLQTLNLLFQNSKQFLQHRSDGIALIAVTIAETQKCD